MPTQSEIRQRITTDIVAALQAGTPPWRRPWINDPNAGAPTNIASKNRYTGINPLVLELAARKHGLHSKWWGTWNQWQTLGGQVKKRPEDVPPGCWGTKIVFSKPVTKTRKTVDGEEERADFFLLREFVVFNADQVEGDALEPYRLQPGRPGSSIDFQRAEEAIVATGADIRYGGNKAVYHRPPLDFIELPQKEQFLDPPSYFETVTHELAHWSEHRLGWQGSYALGELRAEIAACFLTSEFGVPLTDRLQNHSAYLDHWINAMQGDHGLVFRISSAAGKAADFLLSFSRKEQDEPVGEQAAA